MAAEPIAFREPAQRLAPQARLAWGLSWAGACAAFLVVRQMLADPLPDGVADALLWALIAALAVGTPLVPALRYRRWRWEVREHEIDLQHGVLVLRRTLIPMERVQHVETARGVIGQALGLATVTIHTAAGSHEIPMLRDADAARLREQIAVLARTEVEGAALATEVEDAAAATEVEDAPPAGGIEEPAGPAPEPAEPPRE